MKKKFFAGVVSVEVLCAALMAGTSELCFAGSAAIKNVTVVEGQKYKIKCKKKCSFISGNRKIVTVSKKGVIKAKKEGKCIVKVKDNNNKLIKKYSIKVVKKRSEEGIIREPEQTSAPEPNVIQTPEPRRVNVGGKVFCLGRCVVTSSKKINDAEYETIVDLDESASETLRICYEECTNIKHVSIKTDKLYDNDKLLNIVVERGKSAYTIINDDTVAIEGYKTAN